MSLQNKQPESKELLEKYWISGKKFHTKTFSFIKKYQNGQSVLKFLQKNLNPIEFQHICMSSHHYFIHIGIWEKKIKPKDLLAKIKKFQMKN